MPEGMVIKTYGKFAAVHLPQEGRTVECRLRGRLRRAGGSPMAGDRVRIMELPDETGVLEEILPRRNFLTRPPIANVDQAVVVFTLRYPEADLTLVDRILVLAEEAGVASVLCLNKLDLLEEGEAERLVSLYAPAGYHVILSSAVTGRGVEELRSNLAEKISVFAGQSGVGKSRLLNAIMPGLTLKTGGLSRKVARGRHTTRHVELLPIGNGGFVADSPGFSQVNLTGIPKDHLSHYFPEMLQLLPECRFTAGCLHDQEPDCAVKAAVEEDKIPEIRYRHYLQFLEEIRQWEAGRW